MIVYDSRLYRCMIECQVTQVGLIRVKCDMVRYWGIGVLALLGGMKGVR